VSGSDREFLLSREVADIFRVTMRPLRNWEYRGILLPIRLPTGRRRYRKEDVEALLERISRAADWR